MDSPLTDNNEFWHFSVAVYAASGVAVECLAIQDRFEVDVNVLLFCGWVGWSRDVHLSTQDILLITDAVHSWHGSVVRPLRTIRKKIKDRLEAGIPELRDVVKAAELGAEKIEHNLLFNYAEEQWPAGTMSPSLKTAQSNLLTFLHVCGRDRGEEVAIDCIVMAISELPLHVAL